MSREGHGHGRKLPSRHPCGWPSSQDNRSRIAINRSKIVTLSCLATLLDQTDRAYRSQRHHYLSGVYTPRTEHQENWFHITMCCRRWASRKKGIDLELILSGIAIRRSGLDRRHEERRQGERRLEERRTRLDPNPCTKRSWIINLDNSKSQPKK